MKKFNNLAVLWRKNKECYAWETIICRELLYVFRNLKFLFNRTKTVYIENQICYPPQCLFALHQPLFSHSEKFTVIASITKISGTRTPSSIPLNLLVVIFLILHLRNVLLPLFFNSFLFEVRKTFHKITATVHKKLLFLKKGYHPEK